MSPPWLSWMKPQGHLIMRQRAAAIRPCRNIAPASFLLVSCTSSTCLAVFDTAVLLRIVLGCRRAGMLWMVWPQHWAAVLFMPSFRCGVNILVLCTLIMGKKGKTKCLSSVLLSSDQIQLIRPTADILDTIIFHELHCHGNVAHAAHYVIASSCSACLSLGSCAKFGRFS